jgi:Asp-tRNA(Asn)/Glu-tRNA(Gln) amidotransferase A subunit family amidase
MVELGGTRVEIDLSPFLEAGKMMFGGPWVAERFAALREFIESSPEGLLPVTEGIIARAAEWSAADAFAAQYRLREIKRRAEPLWRDVSALVLPTAGTAYTIEELIAEPIALNNNCGYYSYFANLLDLCAVAVPNGFLSNGVAMGLTLVAPAWQDRPLAALGEAYQARLGIAPGLAGARR